MSLHNQSFVIKGNYTFLLNINIPIYLNYDEKIQLIIFLDSSQQNTNNSVERSPKKLGYNNNN